MTLPTGPMPRTASAARLLAAVLLLAAQQLMAQPRIENAVSFSASVKPGTGLQVGDVVTVTVNATIAPGFHMYAAKQIEKLDLLAATFELDPEAKGVELAGKLTDQGKREVAYDDIWEGDVALYHNQVSYLQQVRITAPDAVLKGFLRYQVCDDSRCVPGSYDVSFTLTAAPKKKTEDPAAAAPPVMPSLPAPAVQADTAARTTAQTVQPDLIIRRDSAAQVPAVPAVQEPAPAPETAPERSTGSLILEGFLLGLTSLFTPCIFPMIPLTVSYFTKRNRSRRGAIRDAAIYGGSIVAIFTALALLLSAIFGPAVLQQVANSLGFNLFFFALLFVFALSLLGMFELALPSSWSTAVSKASSRGGVAGLFLMALALAIVSFSCTGPAVAIAMGDAFKGKFIAPTLTMLAFSSALALPFVIFAIFPNLLQSMPRSGGWLNVVKVVLGFLELAAALIYLSRADLTMHWGLLPRDVFIGAWIVIAGMLGLYLLGKLRLPHDDQPVEQLPVTRLLLSMAAFWFMIYLIPGLWGAPLRALGGFLPNSTRDMGVLLQEEQALNFAPGGAAEDEVCTYPGKISGHLAEETPRGFCAFYDLEQGMAYAKANNKPVFLDFTGHTCANCRLLEKNAWIDPEIKRLITEEYVLISLYTDDRAALPEPVMSQDGSRKLRSVGDRWLQYEIDQYGSNAQPLYVLLDHDQTLLAPPTGYNPPLNLEAYRAFFRSGVEAYRKKRGS
ncbi:MAG: thioredoxin family protein [Bacteroidia bacterium]|nr:thioredoxin family protein [Bacteroidia bacterium]